MRPVWPLGAARVALLDAARLGKPGLIQRPAENSRLPEGGFGQEAQAFSLNKCLKISF